MPAGTKAWMIEHLGYTEPAPYGDDSGDLPDEDGDDE